MITIKEYKQYKDRGFDYITQEFMRAGDCEAVAEMKAGIIGKLKVMCGGDIDMAEQEILISTQGQKT